MNLSRLFEGYSQRHDAAPPLLEELPSSSLFQVVVIPAMGEEPPLVASVLESLASAERPMRDVEVLVVINASQDAPAVWHERNRQLYDHLLQHRRRWERPWLRVHPLLLEPFAPREAGVGRARKTGMDEAARRLAQRDDGLIVSLDADTLVAPGYFTALERCFLAHPRLDGVSLHFEHPLEGSDFPIEVYRAVAQYELHLRYFVQALRWCGHPHAVHTVGSAFAVRAAAYLRLGGMNRRQGGEDFYFIQKVVQAGRYRSLAGTTVYPSPRPARRVPFGTGPVIARLAGSGEEMFTYRWEAFRPLRLLFEALPALYRAQETAARLYDSLPLPLQQTLPREVFLSRIREIRNNVAGEESFKKRFFRWFNVLHVIRYLNREHEEGKERSPVTREAARLLAARGVDEVPEEVIPLLEVYRKMDKEEALC